MKLYVSDETGAIQINSSRFVQCQNENRDRWSILLLSYIDCGFRVFDLRSAARVSAGLIYRGSDEAYFYYRGKE